MPETKKNTKQRSSKKISDKTIVVTKSSAVAKSVLTSKKLKQVNELLGKAALLKD